MVKTMKYSAKNQSVAFMDQDCSLGIVPLNLATLGKQTAKQEVLDSSDNDEALINEIDMDDIADAIGEDDQVIGTAADKEVQDVVDIDHGKKEEVEEMKESVASEEDPDEVMSNSRAVTPGRSLLINDEAK